MKSKIFKDLLLFLIIALIGFIFPWWSLFIFCFVWSFFNLAKTSQIMVSVFLIHFTLMFIFGLSLLRAVEVSPLVRALVIPLSALIFAGGSGASSRLGRMFRARIR